MPGTALVPYRLSFDAKTDAVGGLRLRWRGQEECPEPTIFHESLTHPSGFDEIAINLVKGAMPSGREYLQSHRDEFMWSGTVLDFGHEFAADASEPWRIKRPWRCFENTMELVRNSGGTIRYAEGICVSPFGGMLHAWGVTGGRAIDCTWPAPHLNRYFGIVFDLEFLDTYGFNGGVFCRWDPVVEYLKRRKVS